MIRIHIEVEICDGDYERGDEERLAEILKDDAFVNDAWVANIEEDGE